MKSPPKIPQFYATPGMLPPPPPPPVARPVAIIKTTEGETIVTSATTESQGQGTVDMYCFVLILHTKITFALGQIHVKGDLLDSLNTQETRASSLLKVGSKNLLMFETRRQYFSVCLGKESPLIYRSSSLLLCLRFIAKPSFENRVNKIWFAKPEDKKVIQLIKRFQEIMIYSK